MADIITGREYQFISRYGSTLEVPLTQEEQDNNIFAICERMLQYGWKKGAIIGAIGCFIIESTLNPWVYERDSYTVESENPYINFPYYGGGVGLAQWTDYPPYTETYPNPLLYICDMEGLGRDWGNGDFQCWVLTKANDPYYQKIGTDLVRWGWLYAPSAYPSIEFDDYVQLEESEWSNATLYWLYCFEAHTFDLPSQMIADRINAARYAYELLQGYNPISAKRGLKAWQMVNYKRRYRIL